ncbi:arylesterase [Parvibaculum sp. MBR-TMA-1.3b-4.2]|jgi:acyl-CoA thioesterase-1
MFQTRDKQGRRGKAPFRIALAALALAFLASWSTKATAEQPATPLTIVALGDSLTAGYRLPPDAGFPEQLEAALKARGYENVTVRNAGVSGDTTSGGLSRLDWAVGPETDAVILELGANDALRGIDPAIARRNLDEIITRLKKRNLPILLAGMYAPPNLGKEYAARFNPIYPELAKQYDLILYPFFLEGVAADPDLNLGDGLHPTRKGVAEIVTRIMPDVEKLIAEAREESRKEARESAAPATAE